MRSGNSWILKHLCPSLGQATLSSERWKYSASIAPWLTYWKYLFPAQNHCSPWGTTTIYVAILQISRKQRNLFFKCLSVVWKIASPTKPSPTKFKLLPPKHHELFFTINKNSNISRLTIIWIVAKNLSSQKSNSDAETPSKISRTARGWVVWKESNRLPLHRLGP